MKNLGIAFLACLSIASFGCKKKGGAADALNKMTEMKEKMCKCADKACTDKVDEETNKAMAEMAKSAGDTKGEKPDEAMMKKMTDIGIASMECKMKAAGMGGGTMGGGSAAPPAGSAAPAAGSDTAAAPAGGSAAPAAGGDDAANWPKECQDYKAAVDQMAKCEKMGAGRDAMKQGYDAMKQSFAGWGALPADAKKTAMDAAATSCKAAADGITTSLKAMGC